MVCMRGRSTLANTSRTAPATLFQRIGPGLTSDMLLSPCFEIVSCSTCVREVAFAGVHRNDPRPCRYIPLWRTGLPIHTAKCLYPKPGKWIHVSKTHDLDTYRSEAMQEKENDLYPLVRALLRCLGALP